MALVNEVVSEKDIYQYDIQPTAAPDEVAFVTSFPDESKNVKMVFDNGVLVSVEAPGVEAYAKVRGYWRVQKLIVAQIEAIEAR